MTALTANRTYLKVSNFNAKAEQSFPVSGSTTIYQGSLVSSNTSNYVIASANTSGHKFLGVAKEKVDNSDGTNGALNVTLITQGAVSLPVSGGYTQPGVPVYVGDSNMVCVSGSADATNLIYVGVLGKKDPDISGNHYVVLRGGANS